MTRRQREVHTLQLWPGGRSYTYRGDPNGPDNQRSLKDGRHEPGARWRKGTAEEWQAIRRELRAEMYADRDVLCCDSALIGELMRAGTSGDLPRGDLSDAFSYDSGDLVNLYADPADWDADQCREYAEEHGIDLPPEAPEYPDAWLSDARDACREHA
jgi:hypothetical protein